MSHLYNWGVIGCGNIAHKFVEGLSHISEGKFYASGSRNYEKAEEFKKKHGGVKAYGSYEELASDPDVDIIYIATPHNYHFENTMMCLQHKKHVLCEKPLTVNANETERLIEKARSENKFLMEALWMRFFPVMTQLREWIREKLIGEVRIIQADFGIRRPLIPEKRLFNPDLAGGALLDLGIYPISLAYWIFEKDPVEINSNAYLGITSVDEQSVYIFKYEDGALAVLSSACRTETSHEARIYGTKGSIIIPDFWHGEQAIVHLEGESDHTYHFPVESNGYNYEADHVMKCLGENKIESEIMPLEESFQVMQTMDKIREQCGLKYPFES